MPEINIQLNSQVKAITIMKHIPALILLMGVLVLGNSAQAQMLPNPTGSTPTAIFEIEDIPQNWVTYSLEGQIYRLRIGAKPENISSQLAEISDGIDMWLNISPNGEWLLTETERFDPNCDGWACLAIMPADLANPEIIYVGDQPVHVEGFSAVASSGNLIVYPYNEGSHELDLFAITRTDSGWNEPIVLTVDSPYEWHTNPALSDDGTRLVFDCSTEPYADVGRAICEVNTDGTDFHVVWTPDDAPTDFTVGGALHHADYAPDGSLVFEGDWGGEQIWHLPTDADELNLLNAEYSNDNSPCVLPDGRIVSLWLNRPEGEGYHELKIMNVDGTDPEMLILDVDIADIGLGCGGTVPVED